MEKGRNGKSEIKHTHEIHNTCECSQVVENTTPYRLGLKPTDSSEIRQTS